MLCSITHKMLLENSIIGRCQKLIGMFSKNILIFKVQLLPEIKNHLFLRRFYKKQYIFFS